MNKVIVTGYLTKDPEVNCTQNGKMVSKFNLAINYKGAGGKSSTTFIRIAAWERLAEICGNNLLKGRRVLVAGYLQTNNYEAQDGTKRYVTEVVANMIEFLDNKKSSKLEQENFFGKEISYDEEIPF